MKRIINIIPITVMGLIAILSPFGIVYNPFQLPALFYILIFLGACFGIILSILLAKKRLGWKKRWGWVVIIFGFSLITMMLNLFIPTGNPVGEIKDTSSIYYTLFIAFNDFIILPVSGIAVIVIGIVQGLSMKNNK